jgi:endonuclease-8
MPEGDTVARAAARMRAALGGQELTRSDFRVPRWATADVVGQTVLDVVPRGKHLLTRFSGGLTLHTHFRMDGSWHLYPPGERWTGGPQWQVRVVLATPHRVAVGYRLPVVDLLATTDEASVVGHLGPDVLGPDWDAERVLASLAADPGRAVGAALLDQRVLAGLGNIYRTEACFLHGVTPWTPVDAVDDLATLVERARKLIRANVDRPEQSTTGSSRRGEQHWVYGRAGRPCRRCGTRIARADQPVGRSASGSTASGGTMADVDDTARITAWCPSCQRGPAPGTGTGTGTGASGASRVRPGTGRSGGRDRG